MEINFKINGQEASLNIEPRKTLLDCLREDLGLTGTHAGCEHGVCGACTVIFNGATARACLLLGVQADGQEIMTIEGLTPLPQSFGETLLHPLQAAFQQEHGLQCGYCTPAMILTAYDLLQRNPHPAEEEVRSEIAANICRCTGYEGIIKAVLKAAEHV